MTPRITVLMPVYNGGPTVADAVESVLAQTFRDFELLVVDDCSTDGSGDVVRAFDDSRIRLIRNERNIGQVASLNRGLRESRGQYVARLDQDDRCLPARLERQVALLDAEPAVAVVGTWMDLVDDDGRTVGTLRGRIDGFPEFVAAILANTVPIAHPSAMFRRDLVLTLGGYDESVRFAEDMDLWRRLALERHEARVVNDPLVLYRVHEQQQSRRHWEVQQDANALALERFIVALSPGTPARELRLLLSSDLETTVEFWAAHRTSEDARRACSHIQRFLADARQALRLSAEESGRLERLVRRQVELTGRGGWRFGVVRHWRASPALVRFGLRGRGARPYARYAAVYLAAPVLRSLSWLLEAGVSALDALPGSLRARARRSRALRTLYARLR